MNHSTYYGWTQEQLKAVGITHVDLYEAIGGNAEADKRIRQAVEQWHQTRRYPPGASPILNADGRNY